MKRTIFISFLAAVFLNGAYIKPSKVEIYQNGSFLTKEIVKEQSEKEVEAKVTVPFNISLQDIDIKEAKGCKVEDISLKESKDYSDELQNEIEETKSKITSVNNKIESLKQNNKLLQTLSLNKIKTTAKSIIEISDFQSRKIFSNLNEISKLKKRYDELVKKLSRLQKKRASKFYKTLFVNLSCQNDKTAAAFVKYPFEIKKELSYNIYADTREKTIQIENRLVLFHSSGEDLKDISVVYASYPKITQIAPTPFYPWYIGVHKRDKSIAMAKESLGISPAPMPTQPAVSYGKTTANEFYQIEHINLKSGKEERIKLSEDRYKADFSIEIDGYADAHPFITFKFDSKKFYNGSNARFYLDNAFIGSRYFNLDKKKEQKLYFGEDLNIKVQKKLLKDFTQEPLFSSNRIKTTRIWGYDIKNSHPFDIKVDLIEKTPVSKNEDVKIESISKPKYDKIEPNGKTIFNLFLRSGEAKSIEFGYSIKKPK